MLICILGFKVLLLPCAFFVSGLTVPSTITVIMIATTICKRVSSPGLQVRGCYRNPALASHGTFKHRQLIFGALCQTHAWPEPSSLLHGGVSWSKACIEQLLTASSSQPPPLCRCRASDAVNSSSKKSSSLKLACSRLGRSVGASQAENYKFLRSAKKQSRFDSAHTPLGTCKLI